MDPVEVFTAAVAAVRQQEWRRAASLCDPASLSAFKRQLVEMHDSRRQAEMRVMTAEDYMRSDTELPREVAEYYVLRDETHRRSMSRLEHDLPGIGSYDELVRLPPEDVFAAWLHGRSAAHQIERLIETGQIPPHHADAARSGASGELPYVAVGVVADGERLAHVVYRIDGTQAPFDDAVAAAAVARLPAEEQELARDMVAGEALVTTCRRQPDRSWKLIAGFGMMGYSSVMFGYAGLTSDGATDEAS